MRANRDALKIVLSSTLVEVVRCAPEKRRIAEGASGKKLTGHERMVVGQATVVSRRCEISDT